MNDKKNITINECILSLPTDKNELDKSLEILKNAMNNATAKGVFKLVTAHQMNVSLMTIKAIFDKIKKIAYTKDKKISDQKNEGCVDIKLLNLEIPHIEVLIKINQLIAEYLEMACAKGVFTTLDESSMIFSAHYLTYKILEQLIVISNKQTETNESVELDESNNLVNKI